MGLFFISIAVSAFARQLRCLVEYRIDEARSALIALSVGGAAGIIAKLVTDRISSEKLKEPLQGVLYGSAIALGLCLVAIICLPLPSEGECFPTPNAAVAPTSTYTPVPMPTDTLASISADTPPSPPTLTATSTTTSVTRATVLQGAGIFVAPDANSASAGGVKAGEQVSVLGRSASGHWFYVRNDQGVEGFAYAPRFDWSGVFDSLPVKPSSVTPPPPTPPTPTPPTGTPPQPLTIDFWDLAGTERCSGGKWFKSVYIEGHRGNGVYTYYWNGEQVAGPLTNAGYTFEVKGGFAAIIGTGKVVSGDGQAVEKDILIPVPDCFK